MKKIYLALILASVSTIALAQNAAPADKIVEMVKSNILSSDIEYKSDPTIKPVANGFEVAVPSGVTKDAKKQAVASFSFPVTEDGVLGINKRYTIKFDEMKYIFPMLEKLMKEQKATYSKINYVAKIIPALDFVESQDVVLEDLKFSFENNITAAVSSFHFNDAATMLSDTKLKEEDKISMLGINLSHPMASLMVESFNLDVLVPETSQAKSPEEQLLKTPSVQQTMNLKGLKLSSLLLGNEATMNFDIDQSLSLKQNVETHDMTADLKINIANKDKVADPKSPDNIVIDLGTSGYTVNQLSDYFTSMRKVKEAEDLPASSRRDVVLKSVYAEYEQAEAALKKGFKLDVNEISLDDEKYTVVLKGVATAANEDFKGTLQITNFDYLAPEPRKVDQEACQKLVDEMLANKIQGEEFKTRYSEVCDEGQGVLSSLRPFADTAKKVKDKNGKDALLFDVEVKNDNLYINGKNFDGAEVSPTAFLGN